jgi:1,2-diacylglycerol 3-beta-glucosyltransferase
MADFCTNLPSVSVLVPARNEQDNLNRCLKSLLNQDYSGPFEILFIDDLSEDRTHELACEIAKRDERLRVFQLDSNSFQHLPGKQRALAQLSTSAVGSILLFCDADMEMPAGWIQGMVSALKYYRVDLINGTTCPSYKTPFQVFQALDWLIAQAGMAAASRMNMAFTAMGNNMAITRKAYIHTGGYAAIRPSITEDYALFRAAQKKGYRLIHLFEPTVLGNTQPAFSCIEWIQQHQRWLTGFHQLPLIQRIPAYLNLGFILLFAVGFILFPTGNWVRLILLWIWLLRFLFMVFSLMKVRRFRLIFFLPLFELLYPFAYGLLFLLKPFTGQVNWKGRNFTLPSLYD